MALNGTQISTTPTAAPLHLDDGTKDAGTIMKADAMAAFSGSELTYSGGSQGKHELNSVRDIDDEEELLRGRVAQLWMVQNQHASGVKHTRKMLKAVRVELGAELFRLKQHLVRVGRGGGWTPFLKRIRIPRTTADRLVDQHRRSVESPSSSSDGAIEEQNPINLARFAQTTAARLLQKLGSQDAVEEFLAAVRSLLPSLAASDRHSI